MKTRRLHLSVTLLTAILFLCGCTGADGTIRLGLVSGLSGGNADAGEAGRNGAMIAVEEVNENGGINGRGVELIIRDDGNDAAKAAEAARDLIGRDVDAIIGAFTTTTTEGVLSVAEPAGTLVVSPTASAYHLSGKDDMLIRLNSSTKDNAGDYAEYMYGTRNFRKVSIAMDVQNRSFTESWLKFFEQSFSAAGGSTAAAVEFDTRSMTEFGVLISRLLAPNPDAVLLIANSVDTARITQQLRKADPRIPVMPVEWAGTVTLIELGGHAVEGMQLLQNVNMFQTGPDFLSFTRTYLARFGREPSYSSVMAYEAAKVVLEACRRKSKREPLKEAVLKYGPYKGFQQMLDFDEYGDLKRMANFVEIRDKRFIPIGQ